MVADLELEEWQRVLAIIAQAQSSSQEVHNASIAIADEDHSELSRRIAACFYSCCSPPRRSL